MKSSIVLLPLLASFGLAFPLLVLPRQNAGSTSTSTTNNNGLLNLGLTGGAASAAEDGNSTSSTSTSECGMFSPSLSLRLSVMPVWGYPGCIWNRLLTLSPGVLECSSGSSAAGPTDADADSAASGLSSSGVTLPALPNLPVVGST